MWGLGVRDSRVLYLPNGPDPNLQQRVSLDPPPFHDDGKRVRAALDVGDAPLAIYVGLVSLRSDLDLLVRAMPDVLAAIPDARLVIVGDGDGLPALQIQVQQAGLADRVIFTGRLAPDEVAPYLAAADVAVAPYRDTLINRAKCAAKVIHYMAMGKPIVSSRVGQNLEYLDEGRAGWLADPGSSADLAAGMIALLSDRQRAAELARRAQQRIWSHFDWRQQVIHLEQAYHTAMRRP